MSDIRIRTTMENMITQLNIAVKTVVMYSLSHPYAQNAIAQGFRKDNY